MSVQGNNRTTRARCKAILDNEEAKGREAQARTLAFDTDLTPDQAIAVLKTGAKATVAGGVFAAAMNAGGNPKVGGGGNEEETDDQAAKRIVSYHPNFKRSAGGNPKVGDGGDNESDTDETAAKRIVSFHPNFKRSA